MLFTLTTILTAVMVTTVVLIFHLINGWIAIPIIGWVVGIWMIGIYWLCEYDEYRTWHSRKK